MNPNVLNYEQYFSMKTENININININNGV